MSGERQIYLDNHSTTRVDDRVLDAMLPYFTRDYGNAASRSHSFGWVAEAAVDMGREQVSRAVGGASNEIVFTSGATEANNLALFGAARARGRPGRVVTCAIEHPSVLDVCRRLQRDGHEVEYLPVDRYGFVDADQLAGRVDGDTFLVSIMAANNEIGTVQAIPQLAAAVKARNSTCLFHCDGAQAVGRIPVDVNGWGIDMLSISAHKLYGPKGVGALWVRRRPRVRLVPILEGGGHEQGLRSGTVPVPLVVGFGLACQLAVEEMPAESRRISELRDRLCAGITDRLAGVTVNGPVDARVPGNLSVSFEGVDGDAVILAMRDVAVSTGSACSSAQHKPSAVLAAIGVSDALSTATLRFGIGRFNSEAEIDGAIERIVDTVARLRRSAPGGPL